MAARTCQLMLRPSGACLHGETLFTPILQMQTQIQQGHRGYSAQKGNKAELQERAPKDDKYSQRAGACQHGMGIPLGTLDLLIEFKVKVLPVCA